ncbi:hypothetical protein ABMA28_016952 [Loxostege sticticalis]|uniref:Secreted protein n=1 Tax=Loxostege sticticalis TaxID=481309 RepID=A0ABD0T9C9_LOXSC
MFLLILAIAKVVPKNSNLASEVHPTNIVQGKVCKARNGGGRSFQHLEAANLNEPRKAAVRWTGVRKTFFVVAGRTLSRGHRASGAGRPGRHHSCERIYGPFSSRSTSTRACGTPRAPDET